jgi:hypothetical protein
LDKEIHRVTAMWAAAILSQSKDPFGLHRETKTTTHGTQGFQDLLDTEMAKLKQQDKEVQGDRI